VADNPGWRATADGDLPDRTTTEWLHLARRYLGAYGVPAEDVTDRSIREYRVAAMFRARTFQKSCRCRMIPIMLNALPAAEGGPMTCIDDH
jgi:hypothetical protein